MKTFTFKSYPPKKTAQGAEIRFEPKPILIGMIVNAPTGQGFTLDMLRKRSRIADVLERANGSSVTMEDADHAELCNIVNSFSSFIGGDFIDEVIEMCDAVLEAKTAEVKQDIKKAS